MAAVEPVLEGVGQGDDGDVGGGVQDIVGGAGAAAAAADQADLDGVAAGGVDAGRKQRRRQPRRWPRRWWS